MAISVPGAKPKKSKKKKKKGKSSIGQAVQKVGRKLSRGGKRRKGKAPKGKAAKTGSK